MKVYHVIMLFTVILLNMACAARAADLPSPGAITIKAGVGIESNAVHNAGFAGGIDYIFHPSSTLQPFNVSLYGDLLNNSSFGLGVAIRNSGPFYVGAGAGIYSMSVTPAGGCQALPGGGCANRTFTSNGLGGKVFGGFSVAPFTSLELGYDFTPAANGIQTNVVTAQLAVRF